MFQIIDDDDQVLPVGQVGNIAIRTNPSRPVGLFKAYEVYRHHILVYFMYSGTSPYDRSPH